MSEKLGVPMLKVYWKKFASVVQSGARYETLLCLRDYDDDSLGDVGRTVFWQLRDIVQTIFNYKAGPHKAMNMNIDNWTTLLHDFQLDFDEHVHLTPKQAGGRGKPLGKTASEMEMTTLSLVLVLTTLGNHGYNRIADPARFVLDMFLEQCLSADTATGLIVTEFPPAYVNDQLPDFDMEVAADAPELLAGLLEIIALGLSPQRMVATQLRFLCEKRAMLDARRDNLAGLMFDLCYNIVATVIDENKIWKDSFEYNFLEKGADLVMQGPTKRRRMNADLQTALGSAIVQARAAPTTNAFLRSNPSLYANADQGLRFNQRFVGSAVACNWRRFSNCSHLSVVFDPVRCGSPPTDTLVCLGYDPEHKVGGWCAPMDHDFVLSVSFVLLVFVGPWVG